MTKNAIAGHKNFQTIPLAERFWAKVLIAGLDECWLWQGSRKGRDPARAYGMVWVDGRSRPAHVVAWELTHGQPFPVGMDGCHTCDNPPCVNPAHIFPGTASDNALDAFGKGRVAMPPQGGERNPNVRLTLEQVRQIKASTLSNRALGKLLGVNYETVRRVRVGRTWRNAE